MVVVELRVSTIRESSVVDGLGWREKVGVVWNEGSFRRWEHQGMELKWA